MSNVTIVCGDADKELEVIAAVSRIAREGMRSTDAEIIQLMIEN